jgi:DNA polymerase-3 subunit delta
MFYIFHGDDSHSQKETLVSLRAKLGDASMLDLNTTRFDWPVTLAELHQACDAIPFLAPARLVIVEDLFVAKPDKTFEDELLAYLPQLPETTRLVFLESKALPGNHPVVKLAEQEDSGFARLFRRPEGGNLERWIRQRVSQKGGQISARAVHMLASNIGNDLPILDNEIEKLVMYKGTEEEIEAEDVALLSPYAAEANIFDLVDAVGNRDGKKAAALLHQKFGEGSDPFYLFSMFVRQFRLLILVKELAEGGDRPPAISRQLNLHSFVVGKLYQQAQHFSLTQLEQVYRHLLDIDVGVKTGRNDMPTALSLLVSGLTAPVD